VAACKFSISDIFDDVSKIDKEALIQRGIIAKRWLKARPEKVIAVVSHASFMRTVICNRKLDNADFRVFEFEGGEEKENEGPRLVESEMTASTGGGMGRSYDGYFSWEENDFKYMPKKSALSEGVIGVTRNGWCTPSILQCGCQKLA
jgi:hypothetical protein